VFRNVRSDDLAVAVLQAVLGAPVCRRPVDGVILGAVEC
jgi:hypothetical protein